MPPLKTVFGKEAELQQELKQKETFIAGLKVEFRRALREMIIKQQNEMIYFFLIYLLSTLLNSKNTLLVFCPYLFRFSTI